MLVFLQFGVGDHYWCVHLLHIRASVLVFVPRDFGHYMSKRFSRGKEKYEFFFMVDNAFKTSASRRSKYGLKLGEGERYSD